MVEPDMPAALRQAFEDRYQASADDPHNADMLQTYSQGWEDCSLRGGQQGWRPISEAPEGELLVVGWLDPEDTENPERHHFDWLEDGAWMNHEDAREHFLMCSPPGSRGPKEAAPYTHFMRLGRIPAPPPSTHPQETEQ